MSLIPTLGTVLELNSRTVPNGKNDYDNAYVNYMKSDYTAMECVKVNNNGEFYVLKLQDGDYAIQLVYNDNSYCSSFPLKYSLSKNSSKVLNEKGQIIEKSDFKLYAREFSVFGKIVDDDGNGYSNAYTNISYLGTNRDGLYLDTLNVDMYGNLKFGTCNGESESDYCLDVYPVEGDLQHIRFRLFGFIKTISAKYNSVVTEILMDSTGKKQVKNIKSVKSVIKNNAVLMRLVIPAKIAKGKYRLQILISTMPNVKFYINIEIK